MKQNEEICIIDTLWFEEKYGEYPADIIREFWDEIVAEFNATFNK